MPSPGDTICGELQLERLASASLGAEVFQPVFVARNVDRDERLWLSVVDEAFVPTGVAMSTFMAGANALVSVRHPALVRVVLVDREMDYCVVGYEELPGAEPLADIIVRGGSRRLLARAAIEVARGLAYLHRRELLHGALTPGTVVLWEGVPVLWEYGLAGLCVPEKFGPRARSLGGDVVAPEVPSGAPLTPAVDVYAWGAVMASIASGELGAEAVAAVLEGDVNPQHQGPLLDVVVSALRENPGDRPRDGVHLLELLQRSLAAIDPAVSGEASGPATAREPDGLQELAQRYLEEMSKLEQREPSHPVPTPTASTSPAKAGSLGRVQLVKRSKSGPVKASVTRPWLAGTPPKEKTPDDEAEQRSRLPTPTEPSPLPEGEPSEIPPLPPPPTSAALDAATVSDAEPEWEGSYRLPSGTYAAVRDSPRPAGDGAVRGPEPGVSGADAGVLGNAAAGASGTAWTTKTPGPNALGWLRPADPKPEHGAVDDLFELDRWSRELPDGLRKRWVLSNGGPPLEVSNSGLPRSPGRGPDDAVPRLSDEEETPAEGIAIVDPRPPSRTDDDLPPSERETPPSVEVRSRPPSADPSAVPMPERTSEEELALPPMPDGAPEPESAAAVSPPARRDPAPFRVPRLPGPHGPPATAFGVLGLMLAGTLAIAATLSASSALGGFGQLFSKPSATTDDAEALGDPAAAEGAEPDGPCPEGMVLVGESAQGAEAGGFCIDRAEHPGIDRMPSVDVDLAHARQGCGARGHALCTEAQWTRACRGTSDWRFPYGPQADGKRCRVGQPKASPKPSGTDVGCVSPEGAFDLVGNVAEWTEEGAVMGGSVHSKASATCATRQRLKGSATRPVVGFRCCAPLVTPRDDIELE